VNRLQFLLVKLSEECNDVGKEAAKIIQFGLDSFDPADPLRLSNRRRLINELLDVLAVMEMLDTESGIGVNIEQSRNAIDHKKRKVEKYYLRSQKMGHMDQKLPDVRFYNSFDEMDVAEKSLLTDRLREAPAHVGIVAVDYYWFDNGDTEEMFCATCEDGKDVIEVTYDGITVQADFMQGQTLRRQEL